MCTTLSSSGTNAPLHLSFQNVYSLPVYNLQFESYKPSS